MIISICYMLQAASLMIEYQSLLMMVIQEMMDLAWFD